jgi:membrane carboxypeptidase/penicillin-binding protein
LAKGPNYFSPDRHPERARQRVGYVLDRMKEEKIVTANQAETALASRRRLVPYERGRRDTGFYFVDEVSREAARLAGIKSLTAAALEVKSTVMPDLQRTTESALQEGLAQYEITSSRTPRIAVAESSVEEGVKRIEASRKQRSGPPAWIEALQTLALPLYDVHWAPAVVVKRPPGNAPITVGFSDGRTVPLNLGTVSGERLRLYDVIFVRRFNRNGKPLDRAELRLRPAVQGAAIVLENKTGRVLAMAGGFSFPLSQINRTTQTQRQPGSAFKPVVYLAALRGGLQPNTLLEDQPITLPPLDAGMRAAHVGYWTPKNYDGKSGGTMTLRQALEASRNVVTVRLLSGGIERTPRDSLQRVCALAREAGLYPSCIHFYPFVLGAQPVRLIDLAAFYASIANEGQRVVPHVIDAIVSKGTTVYQHQAAATEPSAFDRSAAYQLKTLLQGVVERGTARALRALSPFVAGKTGTSNDENDAWFTGFTNDITVAVWIGYDNADGRRQTLGAGNTGGRVAVPVFQSIVEAAWVAGTPKQALAAPSAEAAPRLISLPINFATGGRLANGESGGFMETFRTDAGGTLHDTLAAMTTDKRDQSWRLYHETAPVIAIAESVKPVPPPKPKSAKAAAAAPKPPRQAVAPQPPEPVPPPAYSPPPPPTPRWLEEERARAAPRVDPEYFWADRRTN